jgi:hypothetical protein
LELIAKNLQCIKYELKKLKSGEVSEVVSSVDPPVLEEFRGKIGVVIPAADDAKAMVDEVTGGSADAQDAASEARRDAIDSVQSSNADHVSALSVISIETVQTALECIKYEYEKKKVKANVRSVDLFVSVLSIDASVVHEL